MTDHDVVTGVVADTSEGRRPSIEKAPIIIPEVDDGLDDSEPPAFERLPDEIIQQYAPISISLVLVPPPPELMSLPPSLAYSPNMTEYSRSQMPMDLRRWPCSTRNGEASRSKPTFTRITLRAAPRMP